MGVNGASCGLDAPQPQMVLDNKNLSVGCVHHLCASFEKYLCE